MTTVGKLVRTLAADGFYGKKDLETTTVALLDGPGIKPREKASYVASVNKVLSDPKVRTNQATKDAFTDLKKRMKGFSSTKGVFAPTLDKDEIKNILARHVSPGRTSGGSESGYGVRVYNGEGP